MQSLNATEASLLLQNDDAIMIDVREQDEYDQAHIDGVILIPLSELPQKILEIDFAPFKDKKIIFQCLKGGRSAQALSYLEENILKSHDLYNLDGGILAWAEADLPLITQNSNDA